MTGTLRTRAPVSSLGTPPTACLQRGALPSTITSPREGPARMADPERHSLAAACRALVFRVPRTRSGLGPRNHRSGESGISARLGRDWLPCGRADADHPAVLDRDPHSARAASLQRVCRDADDLGYAQANRWQSPPRPRSLQLWV